MKIKSLYKEKSNTEFEKNILHKVDGEVNEVETELLVEHYTTLFINDIEVATLVCTGTSIVELAIGRIISEGILTDINSIDSITRVDLLKYHDLGKYKWEALNVPYELEGIRIATDEDIDRVKKILES